MGAVEAALDAALAAEAPRALVTVASGKFFSNGLDLDWLAAHAEELPTFIDRAHGLFARLLTAGIPTVAAVRGRRYGGRDALAAGIVDSVAEADEVERLAFDWARERAADDPTTLATIKERLHADTLAALRADSQV